MAFKPNYRQQRAERTKAKKERQEEKLQRQQERTAQRKADTTTSHHPESEGEQN